MKTNLAPLIGLALGIALGAIQLSGKEIPKEGTIPFICGYLSAYAIIGLVVGWLASRSATARQQEHGRTK